MNRSLERGLGRGERAGEGKLEVHARSGRGLAGGVAGEEVGGDDVAGGRCDGGNAQQHRHVRESDVAVAILSNAVRFHGNIAKASSPVRPTTRVRTSTHAIATPKTMLIAVAIPAYLIEFKID